MPTDERDHVRGTLYASEPGIEDRFRNYFLSFLRFLDSSVPMEPATFPLAGFCNVRVHHLRRIDDTVELLFRYKSQLQCGLLEG